MLSDACAEPVHGLGMRCVVPLPKGLPMKPGDDPTDPGPTAPDTDPGPDPQDAAPREPQIDDPAVAKLLSGLSFKSGWAPRRHSVAQTDGELAAKWSADAREAPTANRTPTPEPNVVLACTDEPALLESSVAAKSAGRLRDTAPALRFRVPGGLEAQSAEKTLDEGLEKTADVDAATHRRRLYGYGGLLAAAVLACAIAVLARRPASTASEAVLEPATPASPAPEPRRTAAPPTATASASPTPTPVSSAPASQEAPQAQPLPEKPVFSAPTRRPATPPVRAHNPEPPTSPPAPAPAPGRDPSSSPF
jgi:hypothetical protein